MAQALAVGSLFEDHRRFLWGLCYRMTGCAADADDVVQDTFVRAIEHPPRRIDEALRPWLIKVALNLARDLLRGGVGVIMSGRGCLLQSDGAASHEPAAPDGRA